MVASSSNANVSNTMYYDVSQLMAEPVTPQETLLKDKDDMKVRMELLIMKIQVIKNLVNDFSTMTLIRE